jgi:hypothetical protein
MPKFYIAAVIAGFALVHVRAQTTLTPDDAPSAATCTNGTQLSGTVRDTTQALIPGATLRLEGISTTSGSDGRFHFACVPAGKHQFTISMPGFSTSTIDLTTPHPAALNLTLAPAEVQTQVDVAAEAASTPNPTAAGPTQTISGERLQTLADDPDDLMRELQQLASAAGGSPSSATIAMDGFEPGEGGAHLPPKSSIAYIKVNPDLFSSEYRNPPFGGGRIEIYTKPGAPTFHGALFATNSSSWMNARDPFSNAPSSIGKQRYGFELSGPIFKHGSDFSTSLEHRYVNNFTVVNAITVNAAGTQSPILQTVPTPQNLWSGLLRTDWQLAPKDTLIVSVDTFNNDLQNSGVGGSSLLETGFEHRNFDTNLHITNVTTISPKIMHETRLGMEFDGYSNTPNSLAPQVSVAGAFTSGGASVGDSREHEIQSSIYDDAIIQTKAHLLKVGMQLEFVNIRTYNRNSFNGAYTFGGGVTSSGAVISGIQQYLYALNGTPNGAPTAYSNTARNPEVDVFSVRNALYIQDDWKVRSNLHVAFGARWYVQDNPTVLAALNPRLGVSWSPDKKSTWSLHAHAGMFSGRNPAHQWGQLEFMDGIQRVTSLAYSPTCTGTFDPNTCKPLASGTILHSIRSIQPGFGNLFFAIENVGVTKTLPHCWTLTADFHLGQIWHSSRTENINSPLNGQPTGPRPGPANLNILQLQSSGRGWGNVQVVTLSQQSYKRFQFFLGATHEGVYDDTDDNPFATPQTTGVNTGEYARRDGTPLWNVFGNATAHLPWQLVLSPNLNASVAAAYNVITGFDNNGDGDFNDRPQYAPTGTPLCSANPNATPCGYATPWGELVSSGGNDSIGRNVGTMPWTVYLDTNLQRTFKLTKNVKAEHQQTLTANIRSSNALNHLNVTSVGNVLGSPQFGVAYSADNGRRVEGGLRYSF